MSETWDTGSGSSAGLDAEVAQRLFGWTYAARAYTTDPAATALVWQWVWAHAHVHRVHAIRQPYGFEAVICRRATDLHHLAKGTGATWPEALCRAALALAEALETGEGKA